MTFQPGANLYTQGFGSRPENVEVPHYDNRAPTSTDVLHPIGKSWVYINNSVWVLLGFSTSTGITSANWVELSNSTGDVLSVTGTANQISASPNVGNVVLSLIGPYTPATYTAHGVLIGEGTSSIVATSAGTAGQVLTSGGASADPTWTTATFPGTVGATGTILRSDGTNWVASTDTYPNTSTAGALIAATATNVIGQIADVATGQLLASGGVGVIPAYTASPTVTGTLTANTGLIATTGGVTATAGAITATNGNLVLGTAGNKILSTNVGTTTTAGANAFGSVTLVGGTATVSTTGVTSSSLIFLSRQSVGSTGAAALGILGVGTVSNGVSFVINAYLTASSAALATTDVSVVSYMIVN